MNLKFYENELEAKRQAYQRLEVAFQRHYNPHLDQYFVKLDQMKCQSKELLKDIDSIETQIKELKANKSLQKTGQPVKDDIPREIAEQFADPIRVITEIAKIKVNSNHLQDIDEEMTRITTNRLDKHILSEDSQESDDKDVEKQNSSEMEVQITNEVDLSANVAINTEVKVNGVNEEVEPNTNPNVSASTVETSVDSNANISANIIDKRVSPFAVFSANSPRNMFSNFGSQMTSPAQSPPFNLFGNTVANTSSANQTSGLSGNQTSTEEPNNQSFEKAVNPKKIKRRKCAAHIKASIDESEIGLKNKCQSKCDCNGCKSILAPQHSKRKRVIVTGTFVPTIPDTQPVIGSDSKRNRIKEVSTENPMWKPYE